jgi:hypothetical protein
VEEEVVVVREAVAVAVQAAVDFANTTQDSYF